MKIAYFSKYSAIGPSSRYRIYQFLDAFAAAGVDVGVQPLFDHRYFDILRRGSIWPKALRKCVYIPSRFRERKAFLKQHSSPFAVIEHQLFPYVPFTIERPYLPDRYLLEFDDAIYLTHPKKLPRLLAGAQAVIVGNQTLADYARQYHQQVFVVPTVLNTEVFQSKPKKPSGKITIGWCGLEYNFKYLRLLTPVFLNLLKRCDVEILILSGTPPANFAFPFRFERWDPEREAEQLNKFDIGIMPLAMDEWCKGKCGIKLLQYMSLSIPSIATPIGVNREIILHGSNGFTAGTLEEWEIHILELINNAGLYRLMSEEARKTVVERYSVRKWFPAILDIYRSFS